MEFYIKTNTEEFQEFLNFQKKQQGYKEEIEALRRQISTANTTAVKYLRLFEELKKHLTEAISFEDYEVIDCEKLDLAKGVLEAYEHENG